MRTPPTGTVTFLFTDIQGSTHLWEQYPDAMKAALARHDAILRQAIEAHSGYIFKTIGDAFCAAFGTATAALAAAMTAQHHLSTEPWGETGPLLVRMALHTGMTDERDGDYFGPTVNRVARLLSAGHGAQVLLSQTLYDLARDTFSEDIGVRDMGEHRLKDLARPEHIYQLITPDLPTDFPPLKTVDSHPNNIPTQPTPLIGRHQEVKTLERLLLEHDTRLVTLTGPGGVGKTRLALQTAAQLLDHFSDGVFFVNLAPIRDPAFVVAAIAQALRIRQIGRLSLVECLENYLSSKQMLLILDNFEQVLDAAGFVSDLLTTATQLKVLVTSRSVLHLSSEHVFSVAPLPLPDPRHLTTDKMWETAAIELFLQRAVSVKPDFTLTPDNASDIAAICCHLDGLPLAIELAAARVRVLPPKAILARLSSSLKILTGGMVDLPSRQQTLRNTILWSYDLLDPNEQKLFRRLAVFSGGCSLEAIEGVCDGAYDPSLDVLEGVTSLVDKSLLWHEELAAGEARFRLLETIREFALERLIESEEVEAEQRRHAEYFLKVAEEVAPKLKGPDEIEGLAYLDREHINLRVSLEWMVNHAKPSLALRMAAALDRWWYLRGHTSEGIHWLRAVLKMRGVNSEKFISLRARALSALGSLVYSQGDYRQASDLHKRAGELFHIVEDVGGLAFCYNNLGVQAVRLGDYQSARTSLEKSLDLYQTQGDRWGITMVLVNLGNVALSMGDCQQAEALAQAAMAAQGEHQNPSLTDSVLILLSECARGRNDDDQAAALIRKNLEYHRRTGNVGGAATQKVNLAYLMHHQNQLEEALSLAREGLRHFMESGNKREIAWSLSALAGFIASQGRLREAARLAGAAQRLLDSLGIHLDPNDQAEFERAITTIRSQLGETEFNAAWTEGQAMTLASAVTSALEAGPIQ